MEQVSSGFDRTYDPLWANALALLDHLDQRSLLVRDMHEAGIGQLVLLTGFLKVLNVKMLESVWGTGAASQMMEFNAREMGEKEKIDNALGFAVVQRLPHMVQAHIITDNDPASISWMTLDEASMVVSASEILMKYGAWIGGQWSVLGIKDAGLDSGPVVDEELQALMAENWEYAAEQRSSTAFALLTELLSPMARKAMGRPGAFYGVTPILIFREVVGPESGKM